MLPPGFDKQAAETFENSCLFEDADDDDEYVLAIDERTYTNDPKYAALVNIILFSKKRNYGIVIGSIKLLRREFAKWSDHNAREPVPTRFSGRVFGNSTTWKYFRGKADTDWSWLRRFYNKKIPGQDHSSHERRQHEEEGNLGIIFNQLIELFQRLDSDEKSDDSNDECLEVLDGLFQNCSVNEDYKNSLSGWNYTNFLTLMDSHKNTRGLSTLGYG